MRLRRDVAGTHGSLWAGYQIAGSLGAWLLSLQTSGTYCVEATVQSASEYWLDYRPMTLKLNVGSLVFEWTNIDMMITGRTLRCVLPQRPSIVNEGV